MGYRISLYCTPKEQVDTIREITDKEVNGTDFEILRQLEGELIKYDTLANVLDTGKEEELNLCTRIFKNKLDVENGPDKFPVLCVIHRTDVNRDDMGMFDQNGKFYGYNNKYTIEKL